MSVGKANFVLAIRGGGDLLNAKHRLRVLRNLFGSQTEELRGERRKLLLPDEKSIGGPFWILMEFRDGKRRKLHSEEFHGLYSPICQLIINEYDTDGTCSTHEEKRNEYRVLVGKEKRQLRRPRRRLEDTIEMDFKVIE